MVQCTLRPARATRLAVALATLVSLSGCLGTSSGGADAPDTSSVGGSSTSTAPRSNTAPQVSGSPPTQVTAGAPFSFQFAAQDADGDALTYSAQNLPAWLGINSVNGVLSGTPALADAGTSFEIVVRVSDGNSTVSVGPFTMRVVAPSSSAPTTAAPTSTSGGGTPVTPPTSPPPTSPPPTSPPSSSPPTSPPPTSPPTSGTPPIASSTWQFCSSEGSNCSFSGTAVVRFGEPWGNRWTEKTVSGGTPCTNAVFGDPSPGTGKRCEVRSASGGSAPPPSSSPPVSAPPAPVVGSATLSWMPPTQKSDGSPLVNLAGYIVKYGTAAGSLGTRVTLANPSLSRYVVSNLAAGTWYFAVASYTADGLESDVSQVVSKTIR